ncbi:hypothetical protein AVEN_163766-1 [Araneus ventricosus]|uniref:Uncharacterized protein n=1 Tax=Araneus ventricosus TaxID=182803 RepID=A0A4Y2HP52_ARAVE|nr:hypothetical protein AVEN_163766-1 [Araneus ventricosus]
MTKRMFCEEVLLPTKAEELSGIVGSAFRMAYAQQLQQTPHQLEPQPARRRSPGPVLLGPAALLVTCRDDRSPKPAARACWVRIKSKFLRVSSSRRPFMNC